MRPERILPTKKCSVGCPVLDELVGGGIPCGSITELVGESGTGKTQFCLQLLLSAQLSVSLGGLSGSTLYIHSELPYPFRRFQQLTHAFRLKHPHFAHDPLDHIYVTYVQNAHKLFDLLPHIHLLLSDPPSPLLRFPVKLIVIDSIAALFRSEFDNTPDDLRTRSSLFFKISSKLKALAKQYGVAVFVTNQVVDFMDSSSEELRAGGNLACLYTSGRRVSPALGLSWGNCVNSRLFLSKNEEQIASASSDNCVEGTRTKRLLHVIFAPHLPHSSCECAILNEGVFGVSPVLNL